MEVEPAMSVTNPVRGFDQLSNVFTNFFKHLYFAADTVTQFAVTVIIYLASFPTTNATPYLSIVDRVIHCITMRMNGEI